MYEYLVIITIFSSLIGLLMMGMDKRSSTRKGRRIPERNLWAIAFVGGAPGMWIGMNFFRHKTKHNQFKYGLPLLTAAWMLLMIFTI
ncbi:DUF1294 domain-containing protein [Halalkalibacillus halophilus]|uniref:DUF1294 domain-containing protein n=1 Tax=Halalkalibacillus halophilus TaxID=392827 RepID=UPI0003F9A3E1|nr:DUF1294 domain-containing protein [Halalkalibacillus halophilus]